MLSLNKIDSDSKVLAYNSEKKIYYSTDEGITSLLESLNLNFSGVDAMRELSVSIKKGDDLIPTMQTYNNNWSEFRNNHLVCASAGAGKTYFVVKLLEQYHEICKQKGIETKIFLLTFAEKEAEPLFKKFYEMTEQTKSKLENNPN